MHSIKRLVNLAGSDPGFYMLALHSYIEKYLRDYSPVGFAGGEYGNGDFSQTLWDLKHHLVPRLTGYNPDLNCLTEIAKEHKKTNQVRHHFSAYTSAEAAASTHRFLQFCRLMEIDESEALGELEETLTYWQERSSRKEEREELALLRDDIARHSRENHDLHNLIEQWQDKVREYDAIKLEMTALTSRIAHMESKGEKLSDKNQRLRSERFELSKKLREQEKALGDFESTREYTENLQRLVSYTRTRMDYERTIIRLTPEQSDVLGRINLKGDFLIRGAAGTGKTYLLLEALKKAITERQESLQLHEECRFTLLSYTRTLVKYNRYITHIMGLDERDQMDDSITTVDSFLLGLLRAVRQDSAPLRLDYMVLSDFCKTHWQQDFLTCRQINAELENFIYHNGISKAEYIDEMIGRRGMRVPLGRKQREMVWAFLEEAQAHMRGEGRVCKGYSRKLISEGLENLTEAGEDIFFVDEAQDLSPLELKILKSRARTGVIMAGDLGQSIFNARSPYKRSGVQIQGRSSIIKTNFRSTYPIHELAGRFRSDDESGEMSSAFRDGPRPELFQAPKTNDLYTLLIQRVRFLVEVMHYDQDNLFVLAPNSNMEKKLERLLGEAGFDTVQIKDDSFDFLQSDSIRLSPLPSSKGLDMPVVLLFLPKIFDVQGDSYDDEARSRMLRNLLYVCMTRAMDMLNVFLKDEPDDEILQELRDAMREE